MKKIRLKNKKHKYRLNIFILMLIIIVICSLYLIRLAGRKINNKIIAISEVEILNISKRIISESVNNVVLKDFDTDIMFVIQKNSNGQIELIDLNSKYVNELLLLVNKNVTNYLNELNYGRSSLIDLKKNIVTSTGLLSDKEGIIFEIPIGIVTSNSFLSNFGPKIPIKVSLLGDLESEIKTDVMNYGINNALIKISISITVTERIILPLITKDFQISCEVPIAMKMIQGSIPNYYFGNSLESK
ncbi:MAG: sporulation protein YunB [bacterium]|nr:sporulation protein YunB [bacterium]